MKDLRKGRLSPRVALLALLLASLAGSFALLTPHRAAADFVCNPPYGYRGTATYYYSDAAHTQLVCIDSCGDGGCDPTPYHQVRAACCYN